MPDPPVRTQSREVGTIVPHHADHYISTSVIEIIDCIRRNHLQTDSEIRLFSDFCRRLEAYYRQRGYDDSRHLISSFDLFLGGVRYPANEESAKQQEDWFLDRLHQAMLKANFILLTRDEYADAMLNEYVLSLDLEMDSSKLDINLIKRFFDRHIADEAVKDAAQVNRSVLVYHRGMNWHTTSGFFVLGKLDILTEWLLSGLKHLVISLIQVWKYPSYVKGLFAKKEQQPKIEIIEDTPTHGRILKRCTLRGILEADRGAWFRSVELQEPTYKELVVVYRTKESAEEAVQDGRYATIAVKSFADIPQADFEIVLPEQKTKTRPFDLLQIMIGVIMLVVTIWFEVAAYLEQSRNDKDHTLWDGLASSAPMMTVIVTYVVKIIIQIQAQQAYYVQMMLEFLYNRSEDAGMGVRSRLIESTIEQDLKESILGYFALWRGSNVKSAEDVKDFSERLLEGLDCYSDFEVQDALRKLVKDGLVEKDHLTGEYKELPIREAVSVLDSLWGNFFSPKLQKKKKKSKQPVIALKERGSAIGAALMNVHHGFSGYKGSANGSPPSPTNDTEQSEVSRENTKQSELSRSLNSTASLAEGNGGVYAPDDQLSPKGFDKGNRRSFMDRMFRRKKHEEEPQGTQL